VNGLRRDVLMGLLAAFLLSGGCRPGRSSGSESRQDPEQGLLAERQQKREAHLRALVAMDVPGLARELADDSVRGVESFNSMAFKEVVGRTDREGTAVQLSATLKKPDRSALLGVLALRELSPPQYARMDPGYRIRVYFDALSSARFFNQWGMPHLKWEGAAEALIAEGRAAEPALLRLLGDTREAPVWGSEGVAEQRRYRYRVCDYAWALLQTERNGTVPSIPEDPGERDRLIAAISREPPRHLVPPGRPTPRRPT
jgi:hypothetical protein